MSAFQNNYGKRPDAAAVIPNINTLYHSHFEEKDKWSLLSIPKYDNDKMIEFITDYIYLPDGWELFDKTKKDINGTTYVRIPLQSQYDGSTKLKELLSTITDKVCSIVKQRMDDEAGDEHEASTTSKQKGYQCTPIIKNDHLFDNAGHLHFSKNDYCVASMASYGQFYLINKDGSSKAYTANNLEEIIVGTPVKIRIYACMTALWIKKGKYVNKFGVAMKVSSMEICM